jgi:hypothetical protein
MKPKIILCEVIALLLVGCSKANETKVNNFTPIENGFGYEQHSQETYPMHRAIWTSLSYQDSTGKITQVWPNLMIIWGNNIVITNKTAFLVGGKADLLSDRIEKRLIAFEAPNGPPLDITDQVLKKYCSESGVAFTNIVKNTFDTLTKTNNAVQIDFVILKRNVRSSGDIMGDDGTLTISWHDIEAIMQDVKKTGKLQNEKWSGVEFEYFQKD